MKTGTSADERASSSDSVTVTNGVFALEEHQAIASWLYRCVTFVHVLVEQMKLMNQGAAKDDIGHRPSFG
jgi:hypothetical protein